MMAPEPSLIPEPMSMEVDRVREGPEASLVERLKAGDEAAYREVVEGLTPRLLAVARRIVRGEADAEDVVQEGFLAAFRAIGSFDGRSALSTWLHRIVVNAALMKVRKDRSRRETPIEDLLPVFKDGHHADSPPAWGVTNEVAARIEATGGLERALQELPDEYRTVILLKDVAGLESKAIAVSLGITDAAVRQRLHRGRQALMRLLERGMDGPRGMTGQITGDSR